MCIRLYSHRIGGNHERKFLNKTAFLIAKNNLSIAKIHNVAIDNAEFLFNDRRLDTRKFCFGNRKLCFGNSKTFI